LPTSRCALVLGVLAGFIAHSGTRAHAQDQPDVAVCRVDDVHDRLGVGVVASPVRPDRSLPAQVPHTKAVVYVVDSTDRERLNINKAELLAMMNEEELQVSSPSPSDTSAGVIASG
jgi:hypothetical protein